MNEINKIILETKEQFAPDKRTSIFNINIESLGGNLVLTGETDQNIALDELIQNLQEKGISVDNKIELLPSNELGEKIHGIINISVANLRTEPKHSAELATQALLGTCVNILKKSNGWYLIQTPDKYIAWVDDDGIIPVDKTALDNWKNSARIIVKKIYSHTYSDSHFSNSFISDLVMGNILKKIKDNKEFIEVEYPDKRRGYVKIDEVLDFDKWKNSAEANATNIISTAKLFIGVPYLWGGTSTKGVDCSGFTKTVFYMNGVILPRDASQQVYAGDFIDTKDIFENLEPGDLLFFGKKATENTKEKITHVAIYIGGGKYIHSSGMVKINSLNKKDGLFNNYRFNTFVKAKRIIGNYCSGENLVKNNPFYRQSDLN